MEIKVGNKYINTGGRVTLGCVIKIVKIKDYGEINYKVIKKLNNKGHCEVGGSCHCDESEFEDYFRPYKNKVKKL